MSWRPTGGPNPNRHRSREPDDEYPPLPAPRLPPLRTLNSPRDRESSSIAPPARPQTRHWSVARRAERIRNLNTIVDDADRSMDHSWPAPSRRSGRLRPTETRPSNFDELDRSLDEANSHLRALLDLTNQASLATQLLPQTFSQPLRPHDFPDINRRSKRRKLDSDRSAPTYKGFRYGRYGQVEPGQLKMEMVSCDGGMFSNESSYAAENILKDDNSVYCTKGNRCNIILRHQEGTVFTLQELVIKAPGSMNYSHPVREGMIFITMNQDDMLSRTAQYQIQYANSARDRPGLGQPDDWHLFGSDPRTVVSIRHHDDGTTSTRARRSYIYRTDDGEDRRMAQMPREFSSILPEFRVTTECSGDEDDDRDPPRRPPNRIGALPFENADSDSEDAETTDNPFGTEDFSIEDYARQHGHPHNEDLSQEPDLDRPGLSLAEAWDAHANATQEAVRAVGGELLAPHARFFIEKRKSRCTIRFDPPVSGRFILLKMWSSQQDPTSNIDIQSVIARGFAGPRYFPSVSLS